VYGYPLGQAAAIAVRECARFVATNPLPDTILFACFDAAALAAYESELAGFEPKALAAERQRTTRT
jgi:O-acetyl-ADP-ribose deacetylase (regulator of RNase III)